MDRQPTTVPISSLGPLGMLLREAGTSQRDELVAARQLDTLALTIATARRQAAERALDKLLGELQ